MSLKQFWFQEFSLCLWPLVTGVLFLILSVKREWELLKYSMFIDLFQRTWIMIHLSIPLNLEVAIIGRLQVCDGNENFSQT